MGCLSCFPARGKKRNTNCFSCFSTPQGQEQGKRQNINCFSCFPTQENCFSCFQTRAKKDSTQGNTSCFSCFHTREKKDSTQGNTSCFSCFPTQQGKNEKTHNMNCFTCFTTQAKKDTTHGKTHNRNCFSCFPKQDSSHEKTRNTNCFSCFPTKTKKDLTEGNKRKRKAFSCFPTQDSTQGKMNRFSCFPTQAKTKRKTRTMKGFSCFRKQGKRQSKEKRRRPRYRFGPAFLRKNKKLIEADIRNLDVVHIPAKKARKDATKRTNKTEPNDNITVLTFTYEELSTATKNFKDECLLGEGGFGRVYRGKLEKTGQIVAVKQLNRDGSQGDGEFFVEILMLSHLRHPHLVDLYGYCADGNQRLLVYEYMSGGSLETHLLDVPPGRCPIDWPTRMKVALQAAKGLEYLHEKTNPPVIYRDLKPSNILLDKNFNAKLSDFGLAMLSPIGDKTHEPSRVMGTFGYCAPEYQKTGRLTVKSDIYSYGVVLLELITGKRAVDLTRKSEELHLVRWAETRIKHPHKYSELVDPLLHGNYPRTELSQVLAIAAMCLSIDASVRPSISDVVTALAFLVRDQAP